MQQMLEERGRNDIGEPQNSADTAVGACGLKVNEKWPISIKQVCSIITVCKICKLEITLPR